MQGPRTRFALRRANSLRFVEPTNLTYARGLHFCPPFPDFVHRTVLAKFLMPLREMLKSLPDGEGASALQAAP
jgi:hypothetical protein